MAIYVDGRVQGTDAFRLATKTITYTGAAGAGATGTVTVFTVTGDIEVAGYFEKCTVDLVGAATLATGVSGNTGALCASTADATTADAGEWNDGNGTWNAGIGILDFTGDRQRYALSANIIQTVGSTNITAGSITAYMWWRPLSAGATVA